MKYTIELKVYNSEDKLIKKDNIDFTESKDILESRNEAIAHINLIQKEYYNNEEEEEERKINIKLFFDFNEKMVEYLLLDLEITKEGHQYLSDTLDLCTKNLEKEYNFGGVINVRMSL